MSCAITIRRENPEEFVSHYVADHPPILGKLPEIRSVLCYLPVAQTASGVLPPADYMVGNEVVFDSPEAFNAAMASPVRLELRAHFREFSAVHRQEHALSYDAAASAGPDWMSSRILSALRKALARMN